jgi:hypothetical protein
MDKHLDSDQFCDYAENALDAMARTKADAHLQGCAECRRELEVTASYFQAIGDLEPVRAPANFLVKVRARIEKPSRWKALWAGLATPWRSIPAQLALLTILGITILTAYLHQNGGLNTPEYAPIPMPVADAPTAPRAPGAQAQEIASGHQRAKVLQKSLPLLDQSGTEKKQEKSDLRADQSQMKKQEAVLSGSSARGASYSISAPAPKESESIHPVQAPSKPTAILGNTSESPELSMKEESDEAPNRAIEPLTKTSESRLGGRLGKRNLSADNESEVKAERRDAEKDKMSASPKLLLHMLVTKDTSIILSGLKAMGAEVKSEIRGEDLQLVLQIIPSMINDIKSYLQRYGRLELLGNLTDLSSGPVQITLRMDWPKPKSSPK